MFCWFVCFVPLYSSILKSNICLEGNQNRPHKWHPQNDPRNECFAVECFSVSQLSVSVFSTPALECFGVSQLSVSVCSTPALYCFNRVFQCMHSSTPSAGIPALIKQNIDFNFNYFETLLSVSSSLSLLTFSYVSILNKHAMIIFAT